MPNAQMLENVAVSTRQVRTLLDRRRRTVPARRRGIVLIFVVVLLMLLAIMGTAYLAASRADRLTIQSRGQLPGILTPVLSDRSKLDEIFGAIQTGVDDQLIEDLFNVRQGSLDAIRADLQSKVPATVTAAQDKGVERFKQGIHPIDGAPFSLFENYDAVGRADPFLASLLPQRGTGANPPTRWPWISAPMRGGADTALPEAPQPRALSSSLQLAPFFSDPRMLTRTSPPNVHPGFAARDNTIADGFQLVYGYQKASSAADPAIMYDTERAGVTVGSIQMLRNAASAKGPTNTRVYPALGVGAPLNQAFIAGDADGDGMADSGLIPVIINPTADGLNRFIDAKNGVVYFASYRVVDNSAKVNINTALTAVGDVNTLLAGTGAGNTKQRLLYWDNSTGSPVSAASGIDGPNLGFFRSNVGLLELVHGSLDLMGTLASNPALSGEMTRLIDARAPKIGSTGLELTLIRRLALDNIAPANNGQVWATFATGTRDVATTYYPSPSPFEKYEFRSFGDLLEQQIARRPEEGGGLRWRATGGNPEVLKSGLVSLGVADTLSMVAHGGSLISDSITPADGENALLMSTRLAAPNFGTSDSMWKWFPQELNGDYAAAVNLWFDWTSDYSMSAGVPANTTAAGTEYQIDFLDTTAPATRLFNFAGVPGMPAMQMARSIRPLLTTISGVSNLVPKRFPNAMPGGMPVYGTDRTATPAEYPAIRVSAATGTKEQLWRAYWSMMTQNYSSAKQVLAEFIPPTVLPVAPRKSFDAFMSPDRYSSDLTAVANPATDPQHRISEEHMAKIRSAVAACNTIDLRDADNDITALTVDLGNVIEQTTNATRDRLFARAYGTEKQLVISTVVIDDSDGITGIAAPFVCVELYNPSDEPLDLNGYYLTVVERTSSAAENVGTGTVTAVNPTGAVGPAKIGTVGQTLEPGGFLIIKTGPVIPANITIAPQNTAVGARPQVRYATDYPGLTELEMPNRELALMRTRRADGVPYVDPISVTTSTEYRRPRMSEGNAAGTSVDTLAQTLSLVPIDAVDTRALDFSDNSGQRHWYLRRTVPVETNPAIATVPNPDQWKCFYAGSFFNLRPDRGAAIPPGSPTPIDPKLPPASNPAWTQVTGPGYDGSAEGLGFYRPTPVVAPTAPNPVLRPSPSIPIQNAKPFSMFPALPGAPTDIDHAPNRFPYGSPFARNGDVLAVPFIGSYKLYRQSVTGAGSGFTIDASPMELYEYVSLPMDAVNAAPDPAECVTNPSVGRFDARPTLLPVNTWAADLFDFVCARQSSADEMFFPDVPQVKSGAGALFNDPNDPLTDQDGPVRSSGAAVNAQPVQNWVRWDPDGSSATVVGPIRQGAVIKPAARSQLVAGLINLNTAPPAVLRMLPWTVDISAAANGTLDQRPANAAVNLRQRQYVGIIANEFSKAAGGYSVPATVTPPYGLTSVMNIASISGVALGASDPITAAAAAPADDQPLMRLGLLNPKQRATPANDFAMTNLNMTRISNLASTRSDAFTVYITVQAWTWVGDTAGANQATDTRLVGERRMSYVVDRSRISQENFSPSDLIKYQAESE